MLWLNPEKSLIISHLYFLQLKKMSKPYVVGIDIGGTNTVFGIVDARGVVLASS